MRKIVLLLVFALLLVGVVSAAPYPGYPAFSTSDGRLSLSGSSLSASDSIVYSTGYYSINAGAWVPFSLTGSGYLGGSAWLEGSASVTIPDFGAGEHYIVMFSCTQGATTWDCHDMRWQLLVIDVQGGGPTCYDGMQNQDETGVDCGGAACRACPTGETYNIVENGVGRAQIIVSPSAAPVVDIAARELQESIEKMSGATLPIRESVDSNIPFKIYVGESSYTDSLGITADGCRDGGFKMVSGDDYLVLLGDDREYIVKGPHAPDWSDRDDSSIWNEWYALSNSDWENEYISHLGRHYDEEWDLWEGDQAGSFNAVNQFLKDQGMRWFYPGDIGEVVPPNKNTVSFTAVNRVVNPDFAVRDFYLYYMNFFGSDDDDIMWRLRLGLNGGDFYRGYPGGHGMRPVAQSNPHLTINGDPDLCSQEFYDEMLNYLKTIIDIYDETEVSAMPTDGFWDSFRDVSGCVTDTHTDYTWEFVNNLAWDIYYAYPGEERNVVCSVYSPYNDVPQHLTKPPAPNLRAALIYSRSEFVYDGYKNEERGRVNDWLEFLQPHQLYTSTFFLDNRCDLASRNVPILYPHLIDEDLKYLYGRGVTGGGSAETLTYTSSKYNCDVYAGNNLNNYVSVRLFWDVNQNVDELLEDYYAKFYGPAAPQMKAFHEYTEANYYNSDGFPEDTYPGSDGDPAVNNQMRNLLSQARAAAGNTIYGDRVDLLISLMDDCTTGCDGEAPIDGG